MIVDLMLWTYKRSGFFGVAALLLVPILLGALLGVVIGSIYAR